MALEIWSPGRVNIIGDHTDYTGGLALPCALPFGIRFTVEVTDAVIELTSDASEQRCSIPLPVADVGPADGQWPRYVEAMAAELGATVGVSGSLASTLPLGAGLSSSAALCVGIASALHTARGVTDWDRLDLCLTAQAAELAASGVPCGLLDQLAIAFGLDGCATRIDCRDNSTSPVVIPDDVAVWVVHSGIQRQLAGSAYATRRRQCEAAEGVVGPLRDASLRDLDALGDLYDDVLFRRARHVVTENARVEEMITALVSGEFDHAGEILQAGHRSLSTDFETSTPEVDELVASLNSLDGVYGARMTGGGFGGCLVVLCRPGIDPVPAGHRGWHVRASRGVTLL